MKAKIAIILLLLSFTLTKSFAEDTIRYELLKLERIDVDTLIKLDINSYVGSVNVQFKKGADTIINFSFINVMGYKNPSVIYYWTRQTTIANFTLTKGLHYKLLLLPLCKDELEEDCFYARYSTFTNDNCYLSRVFNREKYVGDYSNKLFHYAHMNSRVYKIFRFYPTIANEIKNSGYKMDFIPIKLSRD